MKSEKEEKPKYATGFEEDFPDLKAAAFKLADAVEKLRTGEMSQKEFKLIREELGKAIKDAEQKIKTPPEGTTSLRTT